LSQGERGAPLAKIDDDGVTFASHLDGKRYRMTAEESMRVQMALGNARIKARQEFADALAKTGRTLEELKAYVDEHPEMKKALYVVPKRDDVIGKAANFVLHVAERMANEGAPRAKAAAAA